MTNLGSLILLLGIAAVGLVTFYLAIFAASMPFAIHMGMMVAWSLAFILFILTKMKSSA
jgi:hypothetical protein